MTSTPGRAWPRPDGPVWACAGAVVVAGLFRRLVPADTDTPWHLAEGRLLLHRWADGSFELGRADSFSWTARGAAWHPNSWAFDAVMAAVDHVAGWAGIAILRLGLLAGLAALAWWFSRRTGGGRWARAGAVWAGVVLVIPTGAMRPQLASFVLLLAVLELAGGILGSRGTGVVPWPRLLALAATFSLWACLHGGVIVGAAAVGVMSAGDLLDRRRWLRPALTSLVAVGASCLSPLGITVWTYALRNGGESRREGIEEWQPASLHRADDVGVVLLLFVVLAWALWWRRGDRTRAPWALILPVALTTGLTLLAARNATFAVLAAVPLMASLLTGLGGWLDRRSRPIPVRPGPALAAMTAGALLAGAIQTSTFILEPDPLGAAAYPSAAAAALPSGCRLLNEYGFGGYLILVRPDVPVSQDGRNDLYGPDRLAEQSALFEGTGAVAGLDRAGVACVLAQPDRPLVRLLGGDPRWRRVAADATAEAWVRSG
ncbi:MAG: hypothetical protein ABIS47_06360 [Acidimicrobiales bacterium]